MQNDFRNRALRASTRLEIFTTSQKLTKRLLAKMSRPVTVQTGRDLGRSTSKWTKSRLELVRAEEAMVGRRLAQGLFGVVALACHVSAFNLGMPTHLSRASAATAHAGLRRSPFAADHSTRQQVRGGVAAQRPAVFGVRTMAASEVVEGVAVVLLAGGVGSRMKADRPKQFLELDGKPVLRHSLELFLRLKGINSITVVSLSLAATAPSRFVDRAVHRPFFYYYLECLKGSGGFSGDRRGVPRCARRRSQGRSQ